MTLHEVRADAGRDSRHSVSRAAIACPLDHRPASAVLVTSLRTLFALFDDHDRRVKPVDRLTRPDRPRLMKCE